MLGNQRYALKGLATRMLVTRVRLMSLGGDEACIEDAVHTAWEYFSKNLEPAQADLVAIFGPPR